MTHDTEQRMQGLVARNMLLAAALQRLLPAYRQAVKLFDPNTDDALTVQAHNALAGDAADEREWVAEVVSSGPNNFPLLQWRSADVSLGTAIGSKLYARPDGVVTQRVGWREHCGEGVTDFCRGKLRLCPKGLPALHRNDGVAPSDDEKREAEFKRIADLADGVTAVPHVGESRFEGWYSECDFAGRHNGPDGPHHNKQDMRDAYAAGLAEAAAGVKASRHQTIPPRAPMAQGRPSVIVIGVDTGED